MYYELSFYKSFLMSKFSGTFHKLQQELTNQHLPHVGITPITREKDVMSSKLLSTKFLNVNIFRHFSQKARVCLTLASLGLHWKKMDCVEICVIWQLLCPKPMFYSKLSNFPRETFLRIFISWQFTFYKPASRQQFPSFSKEKLEIKLYTNSGVDVLLQCWEQEYSLIWRFSFETSHTEKSLIAAVVQDIQSWKM